MKNYILVAGIDYEFKGVDFRIFADSRVKRLTNANKAKEDLNFIILDVAKGVGVRHEITYPGGKKTEKVSKIELAKPVTKANYDVEIEDGEKHYTFKDGQRDKLSILHVYQTAQVIGVLEPGTLVELSFFSHAYMGGPILVNSYDNGTHSAIVPPATTAREVPLAGSERDPDDNDPRAAKDFVSPTMDAAELKAFQNAFHKDGYIWIWGCAFPPTIHQVLHKVETHPLYKPAGLDDKTEFTFKNLSKAQISVLERGLSAMPGVPFADPKKITIRFDWIKYFFCRATVSSYTHHIARNAKVKAYGGVMGTYSEYDKGALPLMNVHSGFQRHLTFYKNYLGFTYDPEGRRYGLYDPKFTCSRPK